MPAPSRPKRGQQVIELPASLAAKVLLLNEMVAQDVRPAELARRLNTTPQEVNRLTNVRHTTRIDGIAAALHALGNASGHAGGLIADQVASCCFILKKS